MDIQKVITALDAGGPARAILIGDATGGEWANDLCDSLQQELACVVALRQEVLQLRKQIGSIPELTTTIESMAPPIGKEDVPVSDAPVIRTGTDLEESLDKVIDECELRGLTLFTTPSGDWQASTSHGSKNSWTCASHPDAITAIMEVLQRRINRIGGVHQTD